MSAAPQPHEFTWSQRRPPRAKIGAPFKLQPWQQSYLRRVRKLRHALRDKALAHRFGVSITTLHTYMRRLPRE